MAVKLNQSLVKIQEDLLENGAEYSFFQAFHLLNKINDAYPVLPRKPKRRIDIRPDLNLGFAESDISEVVELDKNLGFEVISQLPGLYGVASPLPDFYTEELLDNDWDNLSAPREFLDLIHNQLLPKLYHAWKLYKLNVNTVEEDQKDYWTLLYSLLGDPNDHQNQASESSRRIQRLKLQFFSLFSNSERNTYGVKSIIEEVLDLQGLEIEEFQARQLPIVPQLRCYLGSKNNQLGEDAHIGCTISDRSHSLAIHTKVISNDKYNKIINDTSALQDLRALLKEYLNRPIEITLSLTITASSQPLVVGQNWNELGITTRLPSNKGETKHINLKLV